MRRGVLEPGHMQNSRPWELGEQQRTCQGQDSPWSPAALASSLPHELAQAAAGPASGVRAFTTSTTAGRLLHRQRDQSPYRFTHGVNAVAPGDSCNLEKPFRASQAWHGEIRVDAQGGSHAYGIAGGGYRDVFGFPQMHAGRGRGSCDAGITRQREGAAELEGQPRTDSRGHPITEASEAAYPDTTEERCEGGERAVRPWPEERLGMETASFQILHPSMRSNRGPVSSPYGGVDWREHGQAVDGRNGPDGWWQMPSSPMQWHRGDHLAGGAGSSKKGRVLGDYGRGIGDALRSDMRRQDGEAGDRYARGRGSPHPAGRPSLHGREVGKWGAGPGQSFATDHLMEHGSFPEAEPGWQAAGMHAAGRGLGPSLLIGGSSTVGFRGDAAGTGAGEGGALAREWHGFGGIEHLPTSEAMVERSSLQRPAKGEQVPLAGVTGEEHSCPSHESEGSDEGAVPMSIDPGTGSSALDPSPSTRGGSLALGASGSTGVGCNGSIGRYSGSGVGSSAISEVDATGLNGAPPNFGLGGIAPWAGLSGRGRPSAELGRRTSAASNGMAIGGAGRSPGGTGLSSAGGPSVGLGLSGRAVGMGAGTRARHNIWGLPGGSVPGARALALAGAGGIAAGASNRKQSSQWAYSWGGRKHRKNEGLKKGGEQPGRQQGTGQHGAPLWEVGPCNPSAPRLGVIVSGSPLRQDGERREGARVEQFYSSGPPEELHFAAISSKELHEARKAMVEDARERSGRGSGSPPGPTERGEGRGPSEEGCHTGGLRGNRLPGTLEGVEDETGTRVLGAARHKNKNQTTGKVSDEEGREAGNRTAEGSEDGAAQDEVHFVLNRRGAQPADQVVQPAGDECPATGVIQAEKMELELVVTVHEDPQRPGAVGGEPVVGQGQDPAGHEGDGVTLPKEALQTGGEGTEAEDRAGRKSLQENAMRAGPKGIDRVQEPTEVREVTGCGTVPSQEGAGSTGLEREGQGSGDCGHSGALQSVPQAKQAKQKTGVTDSGQGQACGREDDSEAKRLRRERRRQDKKRDERKREEKQQAGERGQEASQCGGQHAGKDAGVGGPDQWSGSKDRKKKRIRSDGTSKGFVAVRHFADTFLQPQSKEPPNKETAPLASQQVGGSRLGQETSAKPAAVDRESLPGYGSFRGWVKAVGRGKVSATPTPTRTSAPAGSQGPGAPAPVQGAGTQGLAAPNSACPPGPPGTAPGGGVGGEGAATPAATSGPPALQGALDRSAAGRAEGRAQMAQDRGLEEVLGLSARGSERRGSSREGSRAVGRPEPEAPPQGGPAAPLAPAGRRNLPRGRAEDVVVPAVQSGSGGTDEHGLLEGGSLDGREAARTFSTREREVQVVPFAPQSWLDEGHRGASFQDRSPLGSLGGPEEPLMADSRRSRARQEQGQGLGVPEPAEADQVIPDRGPAREAWAAGDEERLPAEPSLVERPMEVSAPTGEGPSGTSGNRSVTLTGTTATATGIAAVATAGLVAGSGSGPGPPGVAGLGSMASVQEGQLRDRWIGRFMGTVSKGVLRTGSREQLEGASGQQGQQALQAGQVQNPGHLPPGQGVPAATKPLEHADMALSQCAPAFGSYPRYGTEAAAGAENSPVGSPSLGPGFILGPVLPQPRMEASPATQQQGLRPHVGLPIPTLGGILIASRQPDKGSGDEGPLGLGVTEYAAGMAALRSWRIESARCREGLLRECSTGEPGSGQMSIAGTGYLALSTRAPGASVQRCHFCGLWGHPVVLCSETRDCELPALLARLSQQGASTGAGLPSALDSSSGQAVRQEAQPRPQGEAGGETKEGGAEAGPRTGPFSGAGRAGGVATDGEPLCLRCLDRGHWGGDCMLSVSEAAASARTREGPDGSSRGGGGGGVAYMGAGRYAYHAAQPLGGERFLPSSQGQGTAIESVAATGHGPTRRGWEAENAAQLGSLPPLNGGSEERKGVPGCASEWGTGRGAAGRSGSGKMSSWERRRLRELEGLDEESGKGRSQEEQVAMEDRKERSGKRKRECAEALEGREDMWQHEGGITPAEAAGLLDAIESIRLLRRDLLRLAESTDFTSRVKGFFLRLRFGRRQEDQGGTGYRMARITGAATKGIGGHSTMALVVDLGDGEYTVDGQYVSNKPFTERELVDWWRGATLKGRPTISKDEIEAKFQERQAWPA